MVTKTNQFLIIFKYKNRVLFGHKSNRIENVNEDCVKKTTIKPKTKIEPRALMNPYINEYFSIFKFFVSYSPF